MLRTSCSSFFVKMILLESNPFESNFIILFIIRIVERMVTQGISKGILVFQKSMTPSAQKVIHEMAPKYQLETFQEMELIVNITKHVLVPRHEVLLDDEKKTLLAR